MPTPSTSDDEIRTIEIVELFAEDETVEAPDPESKPRPWVRHDLPREYDREAEEIRHTRGSWASGW